MNSHIKAALYGVISLVGNGAIFAILPGNYKLYAFLAFNLIQVLYGFYDPSYTVHLLASQAKEAPVAPVQ